MGLLDNTCSDIASYVGTLC